MMMYGFLNNPSDFDLHVSVDTFYRELDRFLLPQKNYIDTRIFWLAIDFIDASVYVLDRQHP